MAVRVNNLRVLICGNPDIGKIVKVDMAVDEVCGFKNFHEGEKGLKTFVAPVFLVMNPFGRRVGQEDVQKAAPEEAVKQQARQQFDDFQDHFKIGVLVFSPVIPHGAAQARDDKAPLPPEPRTDVDSPGAVDTPLQLIPGRDRGKRAVSLKIFYVLRVMISKNKKQGFIEAADDKVQVIQGEIPGAQDKVHIPETILNRIGIHEGINLVGDAEYFHGRRGDFS
jgi:hypothetical protein